MKKASHIAFSFVFTLSFFVGQSATAHVFAQAHLTKTYAFPVSNLQKIEQAMQDAANRTGNAKQVEVSYVIDANQNSTVHCMDNDPTMFEGHLYGCTLQFIVDIGGGATITAGHMLYITQSSAEVNDLLSKTEANKTSRVDLHSFFDGGAGSTYFCNAEGADGAKAWACYLTLVD